MARLTNILSFACLALVASATPLEARVSTGDIAKWVDAHNKVRAQHGAAPLTWNDELTGYAQARANVCTVPVTGNGLGGIGENSGTGSSIDDVVGKWAKESYNPANPKGNNFTQVVWKATEGLACGVTKCSIGDVYVCEYYPRGNTDGQFAQNVQ